MSVIDSTGGAATTSPPLANSVTPRRFRPDIQGLRAIAILLVVLYHAHVPGIRGGFVGVDVFFVISGFLITRALSDEFERDGRISFTSFYGRRMRRLLPAAVLVILATILLAKVALPASQLGSLMRDVWYTAIYGINYHLAVAGTQYMNASVPPSALQHFWSLAVEEQFYVVWPILIALCAFLGRKRLRRRFMFGAIVVLCTVSLWFCITVTPVNTSMGYFSIHTRAWELGLGALVALSVHRLTRLPGRLAAMSTWVGLGMIVLAALLYSDQTLFPGWAAVLPASGAALLIAAGTQRNHRSAETVLLERSPMQYMGKVSYAWYLWHWPMLILLPLWAGKTFGWLDNLEIVLIAFWFAVLTYFIENAAIRSSWSTKRWLPTGIGLAALTAVAALIVLFTLPSLVGTGANRSSTALSTPDLAAVQAALTRSVSITAIPANLTPNLATATNDLPMSSGDKCHSQLLDVVPVACTYGVAGAKKTLVLLGDSHAQQWLGALIPNANAANWKIVTYTKAACPIATLTVWNNDLKRLYSECDQWRASVFAAVRTLAPDMIVASQSDSVPWDSVTDVQWADDTTASLKSLSTPTTRVVYVGDTPQTSIDPVACLQQHLDNARGCVYDRNSAYAFFPGRQGVLQNAITMAGYGWVNPLDFFCTTTICPAIVDNMLVRRDTGHITNTYATWLSPMFKPIFEDVKS